MAESRPDGNYLSSDILRRGLGDLDSTLDGNGVAFTALRLPACKLVELRDKLDPLPPRSGPAEGGDAPEEEGDNEEGGGKKPVSIESILSGPRPDAPDPRGPRVLASTVPSFAEEDEAREAALAGRDRGVWGSLGGFRHLRYVDVAYNRLASIEQLAALPSLLAVDASGNRLSGLPDLSHSRYLQVMNVALNRLVRLDGRGTVRPPPPTPPKEGDEGDGEGKQDDDGEDGEDGEDGAAGGGGGGGEEEAKEGEEPQADPREQPAQPFVSWSLRQLILNGNPLESLHGLAAPCCPRLLRLEATACKLTTLRDLATPLSNSRAPALPTAPGDEEDNEDDEVAAAARKAAIQKMDEEDAEGADESAFVTPDQLEEGTRMGRANALIARVAEGGPADRPADPLAASGGGGGAGDGDGRPAPGEEGSPFQLEDRDVWGALPAPVEDERLGEKLREIGPGGMPSLRELLVGRNALTSLAGISKECPQLRLLVAQSNKLSSLRALVTGVDEQIEALRKAQEDAAAKEEAGGDGGGEGDDEEGGAAGGGEEEEVPEDEIAGEDFGLPTDRSARLLARTATLVRQGTGPTEAESQAREAVAAAALGSVAARTPAFTGEAVPGLRNLTSLDVSGNEGLASLKELYYLRALPALESLDLTGCPLADEGSGIMTEVLLRVGTHIKRVNGEFVTRAALDEAAEARKERLEQRQQWRQEKEDERRQREEDRRQREEEARAAAAAADGDEEDD